MSNGIIIGRRRIKPRFFIFLFLVIILIVCLVKSCNKPPVPYTLESGSMNLEYSSDAILVRDEEVYTAPEYGRVVYYMQEEEYVYKDDLIATIFKANYQEEKVYQLYNIQEKIINYQQENFLKNITDKDIESIQSRIDESIYKIQTQVKDGVLEELATSEKEFRNLLEQRQKLIDKKTIPDGYLKKLYEYEEQLTNQLKEWKIDITAPSEGLISYYIDGLEFVLNFAALEKMNIKTYKDLINWEFSHNDNDAKYAEADSPFFRLINPERWYIVCEVDYPKIFFTEEEKISIYFLDFEDKMLEGKVSRLVQGNNTFLIIIEFDKDIEDFLNIRNTNIKLSKTVSGLKIPKEALVDKKGKTGVLKMNSEDMKFISFDIIAESEDEDFVIIDRNTTPLKEDDIIKLK
ncbi:MAG TPA: hypothetical protein GX392_02305 [Clostridiales bacterium]|nr:hypothetical protein [Clostridiales bacterium]